ncbi:MAG: hypothetical protein AAF628_10530 [Planctomycetota bacterium]
MTSTDSPRRTASPRFGLASGAALAFAVISPAQSPTLVKDINVQPSLVRPSSSPQWTATVGGLTLFAAADGSRGVELWRTDGTAAGTTLVKDIEPGLPASSPYDFVGLAPGLVLFRANTAATGSELWRTDGTATGTFMVADLLPGPGTSIGSPLTLLGGDVLFFANDGVSGMELWRSDGTAAGTQLVRDIAPGAASAADDRAEMAVVGGELIFSAFNASATGWDLWRSDGSTAGTVRVAALSSDLDDEPEDFVDLDGVALFRLDHPSYGVELWRSDGTTAGTALLTDLYPGPTGSSAERLMVVDGQCFFRANSPAFYGELFATDGTAAGTRLVRDIEPQPFVGSLPVPIGALGSDLLFAAFTFAHGTELWKSDGTAAGTELVADLAPGRPSGYCRSGVTVGGHYYFCGDDGVTGEELWRTDGTALGTELVADIQQGRFGSVPEWIAPIAGGEVVFSADDFVVGKELWATDGSAANTRLVADIAAPPLSGTADPRFLGRLLDRAFYNAHDGAGWALWVTDGTGPGTQELVRGLIPQDEVAVLRGRFYFRRTTAAEGHELWVSDGTPAGTRLLIDIYPGPAWSGQGPIGVTDDLLFFDAEDGRGPREVWVSDGTAAGTRPLEAGTTGRHWFAWNGLMYFAGTAPGVRGPVLWVSDGTTRGTRLVKVFNPIAGGLGSTQGPQFFGFGSHVLFAASDPAFGLEPWITDGTEAGTRMVADLIPGPAGVDPRGFTLVNGTVLFDAADGSGGSVRGIWRTDGTGAGTSLVVGSPASTFRTVDSSLQALPNAAVFRARVGTNRYELWRTDGTAAGTVPLIPGVRGDELRVLAQLLRAPRRREGFVRGGRRRGRRRALGHGRHDAGHPAASRRGAGRLG